MWNARTLLQLCTKFLVPIYQGSKEETFNTITGCSLNIVFFSDFWKIFWTLFSLGVSVCTHNRQVEHRRCSRTGRAQKNNKIFKEKNTIFNEHPVLDQPPLQQVDHSLRQLVNNHPLQQDHTYFNRTLNAQWMYGTLHKILNYLAELLTSCCSDVYMEDGIWSLILLLSSYPCIYILYTYTLYVYYII